MSVLEVNNVSIRYKTGDFKDIGLKEYVVRKIKGDYHVKEFWADKNVSFTLEKGEMLGIIGTNGAGKSTLLKAVSGIMEPTRGHVKREGSIAALLELASGFDGDLTVRENAYLRGAMLGYTRKFMDETYEEIIDFAELRDFQDRPFRQLSSGMKSRLAFSIASLVQPDILILDEVLSVGDGAFRKKSEAKMREIIAGGAATILVSHSVAQVRELCSKVLWLHKGEQIALGEDVEGICELYQRFLNKEITLEEAKREKKIKPEGQEKKKEKQSEEGIKPRGFIVPTESGRCELEPKKNQRAAAREQTGETAKEKGFAVLCSYLTILGTSVKLNLQDMSKNWVKLFLSAFGGFSITQLLLFVGLCFFYAYAFRAMKKVKWTLRDRACVGLPAGLFAAFMVCGYSFAKTDSLDLVLSNSLQTAKSAAAWVGYFIVFSISIALLFVKLSEIRLFVDGEKPKIKENGLWGKYKQQLISHPFRTAFLTMLIAYIPYMVLSYPATFMGDSRSVILQGFNLPNGTSNYLMLIDENVRLTGHHPVSYTLFIHLCLVIGNTLFHSYNFGVFIAAFLQTMAVIATMSFVIRHLIRLRAKMCVVLGILGFFAFAPRVQTYMFLLTKDVLCGCAILIFCLSIFEIGRKESANKKDVVVCILAGIGVGLLRNDGKYIVLGSLLIGAAILWKRKRVFLTSGAFVALTMILIFNVLMPVFHITSTSKREALSIPFQQTARYLRDYRSEVTEDEKAAISAVLDFEKIGKLYDPSLSDAVKATYKETATSQELLEYFKVWAQMGVKHPGVYVQATMNNYYNYFYPGNKLANNYSYSWSERCMASTSKDAMKEGLTLQFHYPKGLTEYRNAYETLRERIFELPVFSLLKSPAAYVWGLMLLVFYLLKIGERRGLALTVPLVLSVGICLLGPCNGNYFRYLYGVHLCLPVVFVLTMFFNQRLAQERKEAEA